MRSLEKHEVEDAVLAHKFWRGFLIFLAFIALTCDKGWWVESYRSAQASHPVREDAEWKRLYQELMQLRKDVELAGKNYSLTIDAAAEAQVKSRLLVDRLGLDDRQDENIWRIGFESYLHNWEPLPDDESRLRELLKDETTKREWVEREFRQKFPNARCNASVRLGEGPLIDELDRNFWLWLIKWYFLLTFPTLIVLLMERTERGRRWKAEIRPQLALTCLGGPFGLLVYATMYSEFVETTRKYSNELDRFYHRTLRAPSRCEAMALWMMADEGITFEQALEEIQSSGVDFKMSMLACVLSWLMCMAVNPAVTKATKAVQTVSISVDDQVGKTKAGGDEPPGQGISPSRIEVEAPIKALEVIELCDVASQVFCLVKHSRAPPVADKGKHKMRFLTLGCINSKGSES